MSIILQTERLILRQWRDEDREPFAALNADPEVMRYFPKPLDRQESDELADRLQRSFAEHGYGMSVLQRKTDGAFLGFTGIGHHRWFPDEVEIGWRLIREAWGQGYATEAAKAWVAEAFGPLGIDQLIALTLVDNLRSQAVMKRLGMHEVRRENREDLDLVIYRLDRMEREA